MAVPSNHSVDDPSPVGLQWIHSELEGANTPLARSPKQAGGEEQATHANAARARAHAAAPEAARGTCAKHPRAPAAGE